jgi:predicted metal-binding protein
MAKGRSKLWRGCREIACGRCIWATTLVFTQPSQPFFLFSNLNVFGDSSNIIENDTSCYPKVGGLLLSATRPRDSRCKRLVPAESVHS